MWKYKKVKVPDHPNADKRGYVLKHRLVMEEQLGRYLEAHEHVHHRDGNPENNDIANLEAMSCGDHTRHHKAPAVYISYVCRHCGIAFSRPKRGNTYKYCSKSCVGRSTANSPRRLASLEKYLITVRLSPEERKRRKAKRMKAWREKKKRALGKLG